MAKLPDGMVYKYKTIEKNTDVEIIAAEMVMCKHCANYLPEIKMCVAWGSWTEEEGYCFKAEKKVEDEN